MTFKSCEAPQTLETTTIMEKGGGVSGCMGNRVYFENKPSTKLGECVLEDHIHTIYWQAS
jgi:hypothetical protein